MQLINGARLGQYEILGMLGAGGMGEVYRARDSTLKREVALKLLPTDVAADTERLDRFQREAEILASLNHPHIAQIYGVEDGLDESGSRRRALVMELVAGPTLAERMSLGPIPYEEARPIALQMVDAIAYAHEHNVIHRDLKPANVKLAADGVVKVLDFGLAKALDSMVPASGAQANSPTITSPAMTRAGMLLGTAAYMAPEQARGVAVDKRADIWAFGVVLFEMLSGRRLFEGDTVSDTLANLLKTEPAWERLPDDVPAGALRLLRHCLNRDRKQRLQDIGDARIDLDLPPQAMAGRTPHPSRALFMLRAIGLFVAGAAVAWLVGSSWSARNVTSTPADSAVTFFITSRDGAAFDEAPVFALSPNGQHMLVRANESGVTYFYMRSMASGVTRRLASTRGATGGAFWSPDSNSFGFIRGNQVYRAHRDGTGLQSIAVERALAASWGTDDIVLVSTGYGLKTINLKNGVVAAVARGTDEMLLSSPVLLPGGKRFLTEDVPTGTIYLGELDQSGPLTQLVQGLQPAYVDPGWLLAIRDTRLLAWRFDAASAQLEGDAVVVREGLRPRGGNSRYRLFSASNTGLLAIREEPQATNTMVTWFDRKGVEGSSLKLDRHCRNPEFAPDGGRLALECYDDENNNRDIWVYDLGRDAATRLTVDPADDSDPLWSPDGQRIVFASNRLGPSDIFEKNVNGAAPEKLLFQTPGATTSMSWSPDGKTIAILSGGDVMTFEAAGGGRLEPVVTGPWQEMELQFSPDGHFFSYSSDESGRLEIYVQTWPQKSERWQVSTGGGTDARWSPDGKELFFLSPTRELMAASINTTNGFAAGAPTRLFQTKVAGPLGSGHRFPYAVSRDGKRFLMYVSNVHVEPAIAVIVNWQTLVAK